MKKSVALETRWLDDEYPIKIDKPTKTEESKTEKTETKVKII